MWHEFDETDWQADNDNYDPAIADIPLPDDTTMDVVTYMRLMSGVSPN